MSLRWITLFLMLLFCSLGQAYVLDQKAQTTGVYLRGSFGDSWTHQEAFIHSSGGANIENSSTIIYGGEVGLVLSMSDTFNLRLGAEVSQPNSAIGAEGKNSSGARLFSLNSQIFTFTPQVAGEYIFESDKTGRFMFNLGGGYAIVNLQNHYEMTNQGRYELGFSDYNETASGTGIMYFASLGWEIHVQNKMAILLESGYRVLKISNFLSTESGRTMGQPTGNTSGSPLLNEDGRARVIDLSGGFVAFSIRMYIN